MAKERRDSKNRLLGKGEYQKEDGRYMYRYADNSGKARFVYSWTLTKTDRLPKGKSPGPCLRDLEAQIAKDLADQIDTYLGNRCTLDDYFEKFMSQKHGLKQSTRRIYRSKYRLYLQDRLGCRKISTIKFSDVCKCYRDILDECKISTSTLDIADSVLISVMNLAVRDNVIRNNPASHALTEVLSSSKRDKNTRIALTKKQQMDFLKFVSSSNVYKKWENLFIVMLGTGCRVGEACGLTWDDCDFENGTMHINRTISYSPDEHTGKYMWSINSPKSVSGVREIPMYEEVRTALINQKKEQLVSGFCTSEIDGVSGFIFCNRNQNALIPNEVNKALTRVVGAYNKVESRNAEKQNRSAEYLPDFSPHILRHTFCTRLCESGVDIKVVQEVMGHSTITITMDIYNNLTADHKRESMKLADRMFKIG